MAFFSKKKTEDKDDKKDESKKTAQLSSVKEGKKKIQEKTSMKELYEQMNDQSSKKTGKKTKKEQTEKKRYGNAYKHLVKPLVTEKASFLGTENKYVFEVGVNSNKIEIAKAIEQVYGVKPVKVNIVNMAGKKSGHGRISGKQKDWKKAIVSLPEGKSIKVYEGV